MKRWEFRILVALAIAVLSACSGDDSGASGDERCRASEGVDASPGSISEALELIDTLPRPVTVSCYLESLERPLTLVGSYDIFSAQPAAGVEAPRMFTIHERLIVSFVPDGDGSHVLEFAEERPLNKSIKAELVMPIEDEFVPADAFEHIRDDTGTTCGGCHAGEEPATDFEYPDAFMSEALRPARSEIARLEDIRPVHEACDPEATPRRCEIYDALFFGELRDGDFPRLLPTIYD